MKKYVYFSILQFVFTLGVFSQGESNWWFFGRNAGLNFSSGNPSAVATGALNTLEGCASLSDANGNLLFYSDGSTVYNRNHSTMTNGTGLLGNSSSTSSAIIIKKPGSTNNYYVFTVINNNGSQGFKYSEVDMSQSLGLGAVLTSNKNTTVNTSVSENLTAIGHSNGRDVWVIVVGANSNSYHSYLVTSTGVATTAVTSTIGPTTSTWGYLRASSDGNKMAIANGNNAGNVVIFDFNSSTGRFSNPIQINSTGSKRPYGVEFSPDNTKLYYTLWFTGELRQIDLSAGTSAQIISSDTVIYNQSGNSFGALQLGPDKKIYLANNGKANLGVITNPNLRGTACNFLVSGFPLSAGKSSAYGLPTFNQSFFQTTSLEVSNSCVDIYTVISVKDTSAVDSVQYLYGDPSSGSANSSWNKLDSHIYLAPGKYPVTAYAYYTNKQSKVEKDTLIDTVEVLAPPKIWLGNDTTICRNDSIFIMRLDSMPGTTFWWDSAKTVGHKIDTAGTYWAMAVNRCGIGRDTIKVDSIFTDTLDLGPNVILCKGDTLVLDISDTNATYKWSTGSTKPIIYIDTAGLYAAEVSNVCGKRIDNIRVDVEVPPVSKDDDDKVICVARGELVTLNDTLIRNTVTNWKWTWTSDAFSGARFGITALPTRLPGTYWLRTANKCGFVLDTIKVLGVDSIDPYLGPDTVLCDGRRLFLDPPTAGAESVTWSNGWTDTAIYVNAAGNYVVSASNACGVFKDTIIVKTFNTPVTVLPNDTTLCEGDTMRIEVYEPNVDYKWSHGPTTSGVTIREAGTYKLTMSNDCGKSFDEIRVDTVRPLTPYLGADTLICSNIPMTLTPYSGRYSDIIWNTGETTDNIVVNEAGTYSVRLYNLCGGFSDEIEVTTEAPPQVNLGNDTVICAEDLLILEPGLSNEQLKASLITWNDKFESDFFKVKRRGLYRVEGRNRCGATIDSIWVEQKPKVDGGVFWDTLVCRKHLIYDLRKLPYDIEWQDGSRSKYYTIDSEGDYWFTLTDEVGCTGSERFSVRECSSELYAPSGFTPNDNAVNEGFRVYKLEIYDFHIMIVNRWNQIVFESNDITEEWDGTHQGNGTECPIGTYLWKVSFKENQNHQQQVEIGEVNIIR